MSEKIISFETAVKCWCFKAIDHFHVAFDIEDQHWNYYQSYFNYLGFEVLCKSVVIANEWESFDKSNNQSLKESMNVCVKRFNHRSGDLVNYLKDLIGEEQVSNALKRTYVNVSGRDMIDKAFNQIVQECRYLIPEGSYKNFPIDEGCWNDPLGSSDVRDFTCYFSGMILDYLSSKYPECIDKEDLKVHILKKDSGERFIRLFFNGNFLG